MALSKSALAAVFKRSGAAGYHTVLYEHAPPFIRHFVENVLHEEDAPGEPVVVTMFSESDWSIVTTEALVVGHEGSVTIARRNDVVNVDPEWHERALTKTDLNTLAITLRDKRQLLIRTDAGPAFSGLWNLLKTFEAEAAKSTHTH